MSSVMLFGLFACEMSKYKKPEPKKEPSGFNIIALPDELRLEYQKTAVDTILGLRREASLSFSDDSVRQWIEAYDCLMDRFVTSVYFQKFTPNGKLEAGFMTSEEQANILYFYLIMFLTPINHPYTRVRAVAVNKLRTAFNGLSQRNLDLFDALIEFFNNVKFTHEERTLLQTCLSRNPHSITDIAKEASMVYEFIKRDVSHTSISCLIAGFAVLDEDVTLNIQCGFDLLNQLKKYVACENHCMMWAHKYYAYIQSQKDLDDIKFKVMCDLSNIVDSIDYKNFPLAKNIISEKLTKVFALLHLINIRLIYPKYISNIPDAVYAFRVEGCRRYTSYNFGAFEACTDYDPYNSLIEEDGTNGYENCENWKYIHEDPVGNKIQCKRENLSEAVKNCKFAYLKKPPPVLDKTDDLFVYTYDADYSTIKKKLYVNLYGILEDKYHKNNIVVRMSGFRPYLIVGVPDTWIDLVNKRLDTEEERNASLEEMVRCTFGFLHNSLRAKFREDFRFKDYADLLYDLPEPGKVIFDIKDMLGYTGDLTTKVFKIEAINPQLIPAIKKLLWEPYGTLREHGGRSGCWLPMDSVPMPVGVTVVERSDRLWMSEKRAKVEEKGKVFMKEKYAQHKERWLYHDFWGADSYGDTPRFTCYECNIDFIIRMFVDLKLQQGWVGLKKEKWRIIKEKFKTSYAPVEVFIDYNEVFKVFDPLESIPIDKDTKKRVREMTAEEQVLHRIAKTAPPYTIACYDAEMLMRFPSFPSPRFCPIIQWGWKFFDTIENKYSVYEFILGKPEFPSPEDEVKCKDPNMEMWKVCGVEEDGTPSTRFYYYCETDMLRDMCYFDIVMQPQVKESYNGNGFDIPYIARRCQVLGIVEGRGFNQLTTNRDLTWKTTYVKNKRMIELSCPGVFMNDIMCYMMIFKFGWNSYTLNYAANMILKENKFPFGYDQIEPSQFSAPGRELIRRYLYGDISLPMKMAQADKVYPAMHKLTQIQSCRLDDIISKGSQFKVTSGLINYVHNNYAHVAKRQCRMPTFKRGKECDDATYEGATVLEPEEGYYEVPIATEDFSSLYPSIQIWRNLCYNTLVTPFAVQKLGLKRDRDYWQSQDAEITKDTVELIDKVGCGAFVLKPVLEGMTPKFQRDLKAWRSSARASVEQAEAEMKELGSLIENKNCPDITHDMTAEESAAVYEIWESKTKERLSFLQRERDNGDAYQNGIKIYMNSIYGFLGAPSSLYPLKVSAACITREGRIAINRTKQFVERECTIAKGFPGNAKVIYGDTDSVMILLLDEHGNFAEYSAETMKNIGAYFAAKISKELFNNNLNLAFEKVYTRMILMSKKHYIAMKLDDTYIYTLDMKGVQTKRADSFPLLNKIFKKSIIRVLKYGDINYVLDYVARQFLLLAAGKIPLIELASSSSLARDLDVAYTAKEGKKLAITAGMVLANKKRKRTDENSYAGDRFKFIIPKRRRNLVINRGNKATVKAEAESVREATEELSYSIQHSLDYDADYYVDRLFKNMAKTFKYCVPGGEAELKRRWLMQPGMKHSTAKIDNSSVLLKMGFEKSSNRCTECKCMIDRTLPLANSDQAMGITKEGIKTKQHLTIRYEGIIGKFQAKKTVEVKKKLCIKCKTDVISQELIVNSFTQSQKTYSRAWAVCQKCPAKNLSPEAVMNCTEYDCENLSKRTTATNNLERDFEKLRALRW